MPRGPLENTRSSNPAERLGVYWTADVIADNDLEHQDSKLILHKALLSLVDVLLTDQMSTTDLVNHKGHCTHVARPFQHLVFSSDNLAPCSLQILAPTTTGDFCLGTATEREKNRERDRERER